MSENISLPQKIRTLRRLMIEALLPKESHHIGCAFSILDIVTVIYYSVMNVSSKNPTDPNRDIFILSKGHGALAVFAVLCEKGFFPKKMLMTYDRDGGVLPEHMSRVVPGVEVSTGSLGHGLPIGCGFALSQKHDKKKSKVYAILSDGELNEGSNWEAIMFAAHHKLDNLIVIIDLNGYQGYSTTENVLNLEPLDKKFQSFGWDVYSLDGHDHVALQDTFSKIGADLNSKPKVIIAKTIKGKGIPHFEGKFESHYQSVDAATKDMMLQQLQEDST